MTQQTKSVEQGFTLLEVIISVLIIALTALSFMWMQQQTWRNTSSSSKMMLAGQAIEARIEAMRIRIAVDTSNFRSMTDTTQTTANGITLATTFCAPGDSMPNRNSNVRKVKIMATWSVSKPETLNVATFISLGF